MRASSSSSVLIVAKSLGVETMREVYQKRKRGHKTKMKSIYRFEVQVEIDKPEPTQVVRVKIIEGIESKGLTVQYTKELEVEK